MEIEWLVSCIDHFLLQEETLVHTVKEVGGSQSWSGRFGEEKNLFHANDQTKLR
jgi:hypothetical protein